MYNFPSSPITGDLFANYRWDGEKWILKVGGQPAAITPPPEIFNVYDPATGDEAPVTQITVDVDALATSFAADTISIHGTNAAGTMFSATNWTSPSTSLKYASATDPEYFTFKGKYHSRDATITTWCRNGELFMRLVGGKAWVLQYNFEGSSSFSLVLCEGLTEGATSPIRSSADETYYAAGGVLDTLITAVLPAYDKNDTEGHALRYRTRGLDHILSYSLDGVSFSEFFRCTSPAVQTWLHMAPGAPAMSAISSYGYRDFVIDYDDDPVEYLSDFTTELHLVDLGMKDIATTGSMSASSNVLTCASVAGFAVGDDVIVDTGAATKGDVGPGGVWPYLRYANATAMNADASQPLNILCSIASTGFTYRWSGSVWVQESVAFAANHYTDKSLPLALRAKVTAINVGANTLTLDETASNAASGCGVTYDCAPLMNSLYRNEPYNVTVPAVQMTWPDADIVVGSTTIIYGKPGWTYVGMGSGIANSTPTGLTRWWAPHGCPSACLSITDNCDMIKDMFFDCGAYIAFPQLGTDVMTDQTSYQFTYPHAVRIGLVNNGAVHNIGVTQVFQQAVAISYCHTMLITNCYARMIDALERYIQWMFQSANSTNITFMDCEMNSDWMCTFCEPFQDDNTKYIRCIARNGISSNNTATNSLYLDCGTVIEANSRWSYDSQHVQNPVIQSNANIGGGAPFSSMSTFDRFRYKLKGYVDAADEQPKGIVISSCGDCIVRNSILEMLAYSATSTLNGAQGILVDSDDCLVENNRVEGTTIGSWSGNITAYTGTGSDVINNVADRYNNSQSGGALTGNQTTTDVPADRTPSAISFTNVTGAAINTRYISNEITIASVNALLRDVTLSANGKFIWLGDGTYPPTIPRIRDNDHWFFDMVMLGDKFKLVATSAATPATPVNVVLQLASGVTHTWTITTA